VLDGLISHRAAPANFEDTCEGGVELHFTEGAVMLAFATHLLRTQPDLKEVNIHPDGEHGKGFGFKEWLTKRGFALTKALGGAQFGGEYHSQETGLLIRVNPTRGLGDVVAELESGRIVAECKGGVINTKHPGRLSRLRKGLSEAVGQCIASQTDAGTRLFAVVPETKTTKELASRMAPRASLAGVKIALVNEHGEVCEPVALPLRVYA